MRGMTWASLKEMYSLIPLFLSVGGAVTMSGLYTARLALQNPDVSWRPKSNQEPWNGRVDENGNTKRYKFSQGRSLGPTTVYGVKAFPDERPPVEKMWAEYKAEHH